MWSTSRLRPWTDPLPTLYCSTCRHFTFPCLFVCKWQQFYMNHKALINRFVWPDLPFCARLNIKACPDVNLSSRPCYYCLPLTSSSDSESTSLSLSPKSLSYSSTWLKSAVDARVSCGTVASLMNSTRTHRKQQSASQRRQWALVQLGQLERRPLQWH